MVDEREDWLGRRFGVLEDVDVPELWEQIVGRADTEPVGDVLASRRRRWVPLVAAAVLLVLVAVGLFAVLCDDPRPADTPDPPPVGSNTVAIVEGDGDAAAVTPTATAGIVTLDITNPTDVPRFVEVRRILPGMTLDDVRTNYEQYAATGRSDVVAVADPPAFAVAHGPDDHFSASLPIEAGRYVVAMTPTDWLMRPVAVASDFRLLTVEPGDVGTMPTATLQFDRMGNDYLIGDNLATDGPATIRVDNSAGEPFVLSLLELRPDVTQHDWTIVELAQVGEEQFDFAGVPAASFRFFLAGTADQALSVDLAGGDLRVGAPSSFDAAAPFSALWVTVE